MHILTCTEWFICAIGVKYNYKPVNEHSSEKEHVVKVQYVHSEHVLQLRYIKAECADVILVPDSPFPLPFAFHLYDFLLLMAKTVFLGLAHALKCPEVTLSMV